jgi:hypothetical protein
MSKTKLIHGRHIARDQKRSNFFKFFSKNFYAVNSDFFSNFSYQSDTGFQKMTQNDTQELPGKLDIQFLTPARAAQIFSFVYTADFDEEMIREIAEQGNILRADGTFSLLEYCAYLVKDKSNAS